MHNAVEAAGGEEWAGKIEANLSIELLRMFGVIEPH